MADSTIAPFDGTTDSANIQNPERGSLIPDLLTNNVSVVTGNDLEIQCNGNDDIIVFMEGGAASTATFEAGDYPPSPHADKGSEVYTVGSGALVAVVPEAGRHIKQNIAGSVTARGSIIVTVGGTGPVNFWVYRLPAGLVGVGFVNQRTVPAAPTT